MRITRRLRENVDKHRGIAYNTTMATYQIVIDTNVFIAALRSRRGASHRLLMLLGSEKFNVNISVPLVLEYEDAASRLIGEIALDEWDIGAIIDYICRVANQREVYYLWRPFLKNPGDDMVLELAVTAKCEFIVTYNIQDFEGAERFGVEVVRPREFLEKIGELP
jgi:putative PIN family toxin of toxin-antitoxin system